MSVLITCYNLKNNNNDLCWLQVSSHRLNLTKWYYKRYFVASGLFANQVSPSLFLSAITALYFVIFNVCRKSGWSNKCEWCCKLGQTVKNNFLYQQTILISDTGRNNLKLKLIDFLWIKAKFRHTYKQPNLRKYVSDPRVVTIYLALRFCLYYE